jgi:hypothetical protein
MTPSNQNEEPLRRAADEDHESKGGIGKSKSKYILEKQIRHKISLPEALYCFFWDLSGQAWRGACQGLIETTFGMGINDVRNTGKRRKHFHLVFKHKFNPPQLVQSR